MVLGCGPSGLLAAYAAILAGAEVRIVSDKLRPSGLFGAQYLHEPIPYLIAMQGSPVTVQYRVLGEVDAYRRRVYGDQYVGSVSPEDLERDHLAWDLRGAYAELWEGLQPYMELRAAIRASDIPLLKTSNDLVISTIPADSICPGWNVEHPELRPGLPLSHQFRATEIWAAGEAPELGIRIVGYNAPENTVICNGSAESSPSWYRVSNIFGRKTVEWPGSLPWVPVKTAARVRKPIATDCNCWEDEKFLRAGRYGRWEKGILTHHVFNQVYERLSRKES